MTLRTLRCLLVAVCAACACAFDAAPATITKAGEGAKDKGAFDNAFVVSESLDGIEFTVGDPKSPNRLQLKRGTYAVDYKDDADTNWLSAKNRLAEGKPDLALKAFVKASEGSAFQWVREAAAIQGARCSLKLGKPDDAIALIQGLEKNFPRSLWLAEGTYLRGSAEAAKNDPAAAKTFAALKAKEKEWGQAAAVYGVRGEAALLRAAKKPAEAAAATQALWAKLSPGTDNEAWTGLGLDLASDLAAAGKADEAAAAWARLAYGSTDAMMQSKAQLGWAQALATKTDTASTIAAFDHAAIAAVLKGGDANASAEAAKLAGKLVELIAKDPNVPAADKLDYKTKYLPNLR